MVHLLYPADLLSEKKILVEFVLCLQVIPYERTHLLGRISAASFCNLSAGPHDESGGLRNILSRCLEICCEDLWKDIFEIFGYTLLSRSWKRSYRGWKNVIIEIFGNISLSRYLEMFY